MTREPKGSGRRTPGRRLRTDERGVTAVEFGLLAPIFFALVGATLETALVFFAGQALDSAVNDSSRLVRIGQAQSMSAETYRADICGRLLSMFNCDELRISVRPVVSFAGSGAMPPIDAGTGEWTLVPHYDPGTSMEIMLVEAYYKWPAVLSIPGLSVGMLADGSRLLGATRVFRNEPF